MIRKVGLRRGGEGYRSMAREGGEMAVWRVGKMVANNGAGGVRSQFGEVAGR